MSEGGEKPKSLNRIDNIRQSHLCLREEVYPVLALWFFSSL
jgi:hypothetical protein